MAHGIMQSDSAMYAVTPAWHNLGKVVSEAPNSEEAIKLAGLNWMVEKVPLLTTDFQDVKGHFAVRRTDTKAILGCVGKQWEPLQNHVAFSITDHLKKDGIITYESAFSINGCRQVILLARLGNQLEISEGDEVMPYVMLSNYHDGNGALTIMPTAVRVVCQNTWRLALGHASELKFSFSHTKTLAERAKMATDIIGKVNTVFEGNVTKAREMVDSKMNAIDWQEFLDEIAPEKEGRSKDRSIELRRKFTHSFYNSPANRVGKMKESRWAAFNAITEVVDHYEVAKKEDDDGAFRRRMFGSGNELKNRAWNLLTV